MLLSLNMVSICVMYVFVSMTTVVLPLSAGKMVMVLSFLRESIADLSSLLILLCGSLGDLSMPATELRSSAFFP